MVFKVKTKASRDGRACPIKIKSANSRGYIAPNASVFIPVTLVEAAIEGLPIDAELCTITAVQVRGCVFGVVHSAVTDTDCVGALTVVSMVGWLFC